jgi:hypothetical protein
VRDARNAIRACFAISGGGDVLAYDDEKEAFVSLVGSAT